MLNSNTLTIIPCTREILNAALISDEALEQALSVRVAAGWTMFGKTPIEYSLQQISASSTAEGWWTYFPIHKGDNTLIGSGGYKGAPLNGVVEIGYEISPQYREQGLATEFAKALIEHAFTFPTVDTITAHTLGEVNPSTKVLTKCGFVKTEEINDPEDGAIWKWELKRNVGREL